MKSHRKTEGEKERDRERWEKGIGDREESAGTERGMRRRDIVISENRENKTGEIHKKEI